MYSKRDGDAMWRCRRKFLSLSGLERLRASFQHTGTTEKHTPLCSPLTARYPALERGRDVLVLVLMVLVLAVLSAGGIVLKGEGTSLSAVFFGGRGVCLLSKTVPFFSGSESRNSVYSSQLLSKESFSNFGKPVRDVAHVELQVRLQLACVAHVLFVEQTLHSYRGGLS